MAEAQEGASIFEGGDGAANEADTTSTSNYQASSTASANVEQLLAQDTEDESLRKYKEQLLGAAAQGDLGDKSDPRKVIGAEFRVIFEDSAVEDVVFALEPSVSGATFSMKEGCNYKFKLSFRIQHEIVTGLKFVNKIKKAIFSDTEELMLGSYAPQSVPHSFEMPKRGWEQAPKGMLARGKYKAVAKFVDSDGVDHACFEYGFQITK
jgi:Rho GDP-dissociation inhibitor